MGGLWNRLKKTLIKSTSPEDIEGQMRKLRKQMEEMKAEQSRIILPPTGRPYFPPTSVYAGDEMEDAEPKVSRSPLTGKLRKDAGPEEEEE